MNTQVISRDQITTFDRRITGLPTLTSLLRKNIMIEKTIPTGRLYELYKGSIIDALWTVLSSPVE